MGGGLKRLLEDSSLLAASQSVRTTTAHLLHTLGDPEGYGLVLEAELAQEVRAGGAPLSSVSGAGGWRPHQQQAGPPAAHHPKTYRVVRFPEGAYTHDRVAYHRA